MGILTQGHTSSSGSTRAVVVWVAAAARQCAAVVVGRRVGQRRVGLATVCRVNETIDFTP